MKPSTTKRLKGCTAHEGTDEQGGKKKPGKQEVNRMPQGRYTERKKEKHTHTLNPSSPNIWSIIYRSDSSLPHGSQDIG